jgi:hypothetical protein
LLTDEAVHCVTGITSTLFLMTTETFTTTIGCNDIGYFVGDGDCRIQFTEKEMGSLIFAQIHSQTLASAFVNFCSITFSSGTIPSCFRKNLLPDEIKEIQEELPEFQENFSNALFNMMLIFEH